MGVAVDCRMAFPPGRTRSRTEVLPTLANVIAGRNTVTAADMLRSGSFNWITVIWIASLHALGLLAFTQAFAWHYLPVMVAMYFWMCLSVTLYLHRHLSHKSFEMADWVKMLFAFGAAVGFSGHPVGWVSHHRHHHKTSDTANDMHSPRAGFFHSHMGWFLREPKDFEDQTRPLAADCRKVWYLKAMENRVLFVVPHFVVAAVVYAFLGLPGLLYGLYLPIFLLHHHTWAINSITHLRWIGYRRYETEDDSVNAPILLGALGEGWHNNHHADPRRAAHGLAWYEIDPTKGTIWLLEKLGLAWDVQWSGSSRARL